MKTNYKRFALIMSVVVMLALISCITAFSDTDCRTDVVLKIEESTYAADEPIQSVSNVPDTVTSSDNSIASLNKDNSYVQTGNIIWWLSLVILAAICAAILIMQTIRLKK